MEDGHSRGPGEPVVQPATFYPLKEEGEKGVVVGICVFLLLPDTPTFEAALTYEQEDG
jgi:hypothetical protein